MQNKSKLQSRKRRTLLLISVEWIDNFTLLALCYVFVPNSAYNIDSKWIKYVYSVDKMKKMNWNKVVLNFLIKAIRNYRNNASYLCGDILFLVVSNL
jgi:hypothetical protein